MQPSSQSPYDPSMFARRKLIPLKLRSTAGAPYHRVAGLIVGMLAGFAFGVSTIFSWGQVGIKDLIWVALAAFWWGMAGLISVWPQTWSKSLHWVCLWMAVGLDLHLAYADWHTSAFSIFGNPNGVVLVILFFVKAMFMAPIPLGLRWVADGQAEEHELPVYAWRRLRAPLALMAFAAIFSLILVNIWIPPI